MSGRFSLLLASAMLAAAPCSAWAQPATPAQSAASIKHTPSFAPVFAAAVSPETEKISSRYGEISAVPDAQSRDTFVISLDSKPLAILSASGIAFFRVAPRGDVDYIIVEIWQPGLNCHYSYVLISVQPTHNSEVSPVFGQCTELNGVSHLKGGLQIKLRPAGRNVQDNDLQVYWFVNGKITRLPIARRPVAEGNRSLLEELHLKRGQQYSDAKAQLARGGWKVDSSDVEDLSPNPKTLYGFGEVTCGNGRMAVCSARFLRGDREIMLTLQPKNNLVVDGAWDDK